jgi:hypothetical protein
VRSGLLNTLNNHPDLGALAGYLSQASGANTGFTNLNDLLQGNVIPGQKGAREVVGLAGDVKNAVSPPASPTPPSTGAKTKTKAGGKGKAKSSTPKEQPFDLGAADTAAAAPYVSQLYAALGIAPGGTATANSEIPGGLGQYLTNVPSNIASTLTQGLNTAAGADQSMIGAEKTAMNDAGSAGLLGDLLNAAKYQAIYKQGLYAPAPASNTPLGQLYQTVVSGGNQLAGGSPTSTTTNPFNSTQPGSTTTNGTKNPYSTPPQV